jgi:hypothetical protein
LALAIALRSSLFFMVSPEPAMACVVFSWALGLRQSEIASNRGHVL